MRRKLSYILISLFTFLSLGGLEAYGASDWTTYEYNTTNAPISADKIIYLSDNVNLNQAIVIKKGAKITIRKSSEAPEGALYIYNRTGTGSNSGSRMFIVESGGILQIIGRKDNMIILDGGTDFTWSNYNLTQKSGTTTRRLYEAIQNMGTLKLDYVCIQDVWASRDLNGGAIQICTQLKEGVYLPCGTTTITNSKIRRCRAQHGSAIHIDNQKKCTSNTPEGCKVTVENCEIQYCYNVGSDDDNTPGDNILGGGGTIRTRGSAVANLELINTQIKTNRSISGGGLYWNAGGWEDGNTKCTINGCRFEENHVDREGGGMMLESSFEFTGNETVVVNNYAQNHGGGIVITGYGGGQIDGGILNFNFTEALRVQNNESAYGGGISFYFGGMSFSKKTEINTVFNGCNISNNIAASNNRTSGGKGGAVCFRNSSTNSNVTISILMNKGNFINNEASFSGGAIYVENTNIAHTQSSNDVIVINGNTVTGTDGDGGGIYLSGGKITMGRATITENYATRDGGGIYISGGSLDLEENVTISQNEVGRNGAGLWVDYSDANALLIRKNAKLLSNTAARTGGGAFINSGNIVVDNNGHLEVSNNVSKKGGGAYVIGNLYVRGKSKITGNKVTYDSAVHDSGKGGGMFVSLGNFIVGDYNTANANVEISNNHAEKFGGGVHISGGDITLSNCKITGNRAGYNQSNTGAIIDANASGGAISATQGTIEIKAGEISNNHAALNGGAVYVNNTDFTNAAKTVVLVGKGVFQKNQAIHGGGMYISGNIDMTFAGNVINNKSINGGGIYVANGAKLIVQEGILKQNRAVGRSGQSSPATGYGISSANLHGLGGGIYLDDGNASRNTQLTFDLTNAIGLYGNDADWGGDDVFVSGNKTSVSLPNINKMKIIDFTTPVNTPLFWAEDYITDDTNYSIGTKLSTEWTTANPKNDRYDYALLHSLPTYHMTFNTDESAKTLTNKYLSLEVGYEVIYVTVVKKGLLPGENATFTFTPAVLNSETGQYDIASDPYSKIIFVCKTSSQTTEGIRRKIAIPVGWWKIDETSWSWAYTPDNGTQYNNPVKIDADHKEFEFKNVRNANTPRTDEAIVENEMKSSVTVYTASEE